MSSRGQRPVNRYIATKRGRARQLHAACGGAVLLFLLLVCVAAPLESADQKTDLNFSAFRALVKEQAPADKQQAGLERADELFLRLLTAQEKLAAARQSLDRLSGWYKTAQARLQAQSAPPSDVELLRFSQTQAAARVAQFEAERLSTAEQANLLLKRGAASPLVALLDVPPAVSAPDSKSKAESAAAASAPPSELGPDIASRRAAFEKELLPMGNELLGKTYQSYLFGGVPLASLLWQEQQLFNTDLEYRLLLVEQERRSQPK